MPTDKELMQQALDALEYAEKHHGGDDCYADTIEAIRARLSQCDRCGEVNPAEIHTCTPKQEPVAWMYEYGTDHGDAVNQIFWHKNLRLEKPTGLVRNVVPLYTAPPQREWQGLTDEEKLIVNQMWNMVGVDGSIKAIETRLKEKNG